MCTSRSDFAIPSFDTVDIAFPEAGPMAISPANCSAALAALGKKELQGVSLEELCRDPDTLKKLSQYSGTKNPDKIAARAYAKSLLALQHVANSSIPCIETGKIARDDQVKPATKSADNLQMVPFVLVVSSSCSTQSSTPVSSYSTMIASLSNQLLGRILQIPRWFERGVCWLIVLGGILLAACPALWIVMISKIAKLIPDYTVYVWDQWSAQVWRELGWAPSPASIPPCAPSPCIPCICDIMKESESASITIVHNSPPVLDTMHWVGGALIRTVSVVLASLFYTRG